MAVCPIILWASLRCTIENIFASFFTKERRRERRKTGGENNEYLGHLLLFGVCVTPGVLLGKTSSPQGYALQQRDPEQRGSFDQLGPHREECHVFADGAAAHVAAWGVDDVRDPGTRQEDV